MRYQLFCNRHIQTDRRQTKLISSNKSCYRFCFLWRMNELNECSWRTFLGVVTVIGQLASPASQRSWVWFQKQILLFCSLTKITLTPLNNMKKSFYRTPKNVFSESGSVHISRSAPEYHHDRYTKILSEFP